MSYFYVFEPPKTSSEPQALNELEINLKNIQQESFVTETMTKEQIRQKLLQLENNLQQQLEKTPTLLSQKTYINLTILSHYAEENEKASQYLNQARFTNPNNNYFK